MFGCNNPQTVTNPSDAQKKINEDQLKFMKEKCEGKESCTAHATNSWWSTNHQCPGHEKAYMWLHWHCNGVGAKTKVNTTGGDCAVDNTTPISEPENNPTVTGPATSATAQATTPAAATTTAKTLGG